MRISVSGHIRTGSYINRENRKIYYTEVVLEEQEFAESRAESETNRGVATGQQEKQKETSDISQDGFMNIPEGLIEELPFD